MIATSHRGSAMGYEVHSSGGFHFSRGWVTNHPREGTGLGSEVQTVETGDTAAEQQKTYITDYLINADI